MGFDSNAVRNDFPILSTKVNNRDLVYLDNAATTQMPSQVLDRIVEQYQCRNANVHRGIHTLSEYSTSDYEEARHHVARFINAASADQIVFTSGTTDSINMVAASLAHTALSPGDRIVITIMEHHANFVPWQVVCSQRGCELEIIPLDSDGEIDRSALSAALKNPRTRLLALCWVSNVTGVVNPVEEIVREAHETSTMVLIDAAQSARDIPIDVERLSCDFLCFSGHKMFGPTGIGVLYYAPAVSCLLAPIRFGGGMVKKVTREGATYEPLPLCMEAGTPNYVGAIGLSAALSYIERIGQDDMREWENRLTNYLCAKLAAMPDVTVIGSPKSRSGIVSCYVQGFSPFDIAKLLDLQGIAVRTGTNCAQPLLDEMYHVERVIRVSVAYYNTKDEIDRFAAGFASTLELLKTV